MSKEYSKSCVAFNISHEELQYYFSSRLEGLKKKLPSNDLLSELKNIIGFLTYGKTFLDLAH